MRDSSRYVSPRVPPHSAQLTRRPSTGKNQPRRGNMQPLTMKALQLVGLYWLLITSFETVLMNTDESQHLKVEIATSNKSFCF